MKHLLSILSLLLALSLSAQNTIQITEIGEGSADGISNDDENILTSIGNSVIWRDDKGGWKSYFANGNTYENVQLFPDRGRVYISDYAQLGDLLYMIVRFLDEDQRSLCSIDADGNLLEIITGYESINNLIEHEGNLYFAAEPETFDDAFYRYNPQTGESSKLFDIHFFGMEDLISFDGALYILTRLDSGLNLIKSDGESTTYEIIKFLHDGSEFTSYQNMIAADDQFYFFSTDEESSYSLYVSDGTTDGTVRLSSDFEQISFLDYNDERAYITYKNRLYFRGELIENSEENLYMTDGTPDGLRKITIVEDEQARPNYFTVFEDKLYFKAFRGFFYPNQAMYRINNSSGTSAIEAINKNSVGGGYALDGRNLINHDGYLYYTAIDDTHGSELWRSKGTVATTERLLDLKEGEEGGFPTQTTAAGENIFFFADNGDSGRELFAYQLNPVSTQETSISYPATVYPTLSAGMITIKMNQEKSLSKIEVFDFNGSNVFSLDFDSPQVKHNINIANWNNGTYFIKVNDQKEVMKFIKI